jgi:hypothetical protein
MELNPTQGIKNENAEIKTRAKICSFQLSFEKMNRVLAEKRSR